MSSVRIPFVDRRTFLGTTAACLATGLLPSAAAAQSPKFRRWEITDPAMPPRVIKSYKAGIEKMLDLPPDDPRNWYRNALTHVFDCPHGNWWFLVWHRAYLGWFERTIRELSSDPDFALPYWDWTKTQRVPPVMFEGVLDPNNEAFIPSFGSFKTHFNTPVTALLSAFSQTQKDELSKRPYPVSKPADLFSLIQTYFFFDQPNARGLSATSPDLDPFTKTTIGLNVIKSALKTPTFAGKENQPAGFHSGQADDHSGSSQKGILESQPHDNVHGAMAGPGNAAFMKSHLSPVDPIFFLHHGNLDRLWDVWTRRQKALQKPTLPTGADLSAWSNEPFLFFTDEKGKPAARIKAGDYADMSIFDYDYSPGSGEDQVPVALASAILADPVSAIIAAALVGGAQPAGGVVRLPTTALRLPPVPEPASLVADVTLNLSHTDQGRRFRVLVSTGNNAQIEAGAITVFGHAGHGPATFEVPLPETLRASAATAPGNDLALDIRVVPIQQTAAVSSPTALNTITESIGASMPTVASITVRAN